MRYLLSNRILNKSARGVFDTREALFFVGFGLFTFHVSRTTRTAFLNILLCILLLSHTCGPLDFRKADIVSLQPAKAPKGQLS
jgi:hypothetical protein